MVAAWWPTAGARTSGCFKVAPPNGVTRKPHLLSASEAIELGEDGTRGQHLRQDDRLGSFRRKEHIERHAVTPMLAQEIGDRRVGARPIALEISDLAIDERLLHRVR